MLFYSLKGLTSATRLIENFEKVNNQNALDITIISDNFDLDTTSDGAGGLFRLLASNVIVYFRIFKILKI